MPGRAPWGAEGHKGSGETLAVQERPDPKYVEMTQEGTVSPGSTEKVELFAPEGSVYRVQNMRLKVDIPNSAGAGEHYLYIRPMNAITVLQGESDYNGDLTFAWSHWLNANNMTAPPDGGAQVEVMKSLRATESAPLQVNYKNNLDVDQTNDRIIQFIVEELNA